MEASLKDMLGQLMALIRARQPSENPNPQTKAEGSDESGMIRVSDSNKVEGQGKRLEQGRGAWSARSGS